jgi:hypothetical protein
MEAEMYIVVRDLNPPRKCDILPKDAKYSSTKKLVFGPASKPECEAWAKENCGPVTK